MSSQAQNGQSDPPESPRGALIAALEVRRYARLAVAVAAVFAVAVALFFLVIVSGGQTEFPLPYYPALAFVVFVTTAMLVLMVLVGRRVLRLAVHPASVVRWGATGGLLAGTAWLASAVGLWLGPASPWATVVDVATPWAALLTPLGLWAVYTRYKRTTALRTVATGAVLVAVAGALVLADLAAFDLVALLPDVGRPVDHETSRLFGVGALGLVGGGTALSLLAIVSDGPDPSLLVLGLAPPLGLAGYLAAGPGRVGLAALGVGLGTGWVVATWRLRRVADDDVPDDPEPELPGA